MPDVTEERLRFALDQLQLDDGFMFEKFANKFLSSEFPDLRPVGGMHDGGRDAFISTPHGEPDVFVQSSLQKTWKAKIRGTLQTLQGAVGLVAAVGVG